MNSLLRNSALLLGGAALLGACKDTPTVPPINSTSVVVGPIADLAQLNVLTTGLLNSVRGNQAGLAFYYVGGAFARDVYRFDPSEGRFISAAITSAQTPASFFGASQFAGQYTTIRAGSTLLYNLSQTPDAVLSQQQKAGVRGFVHTLQALEYYQVEAYHDTSGTPIQAADSSKQGPIVCPTAALRFISALLDTANTELKAASGGSSSATFAFAFPSGFKVNGDFSQIEDFRKVLNRGLKGQVELYRGIGRQTPGTAQNYTDAIAALNEAIGPTPTTQNDLNRGPYLQFSTAPGELANPLADAYLRLNPQFVVGVDTTDNRFRSKVTTNAALSTYTVGGRVYTSRYTPTATRTENPGNFVAPIPIIRVGELVLLRAQAKIGLNDLAGARTDINIVRTIEGGVAPIGALASQSAAIDAVLYEKRLSLFLTGPQRLVDLRAYNRFAAPYVTRENTADRLSRALPIPQAEIDVRGGAAAVVPTCPTA